MDSSGQVESDKTDNIIQLIETLFNNGDDNDKDRLVRKIDKLSDEDKLFINGKAKTLIDIDINMENTIKSENLITSLNKLQMNILTLFLMSRIPECSDGINLILKNFNQKIANVNEIIKYNLDDNNSTSNSDNSSTEEPQTPKGSPTNQLKSQIDKEDQLKKLKEKQDIEDKLSIITDQLTKKQLEDNVSGNRPVPKKKVNVTNDTLKINTIDDLYNYITDFNKDNRIDTKSMSNEKINKSLIEKFLLGIDNTTYKAFVENIIAKKYTYKRLFGLPERIKYNYKD